ncbi:MAG TPA: UDP-N-acetylmuramoyl-L-alanine--D-glutamate ligase [Gemmatimonadaceae bacterium]|nr:UDP-N-acetylmuramoyl-L-alanine--D-glutamate ligase [Gemmatimonadaceae bacterium]
MIPAAWCAEGREVAVVGLGRSGTAVASLLSSRGARVYASDAARNAETLEAAAQLAQLGVTADVGGHDLERISRAEAVVASPGIPPDAPPLRAARDAGVSIVSEIEVALRELGPTRYIAVTGTNGKTTTTALVGHLLRALGHDALDAGNIGMPLSQVILRGRAPAWVALELSSFQLHDTPSIAPAVGVVTNLSPDHLDRYAGVDDYYADKALLFRNASAESRWVLNADDPAVMRLPERVIRSGSRRAGRALVPGMVYTFSLTCEADACYDRASGRLRALGGPLLERSALGLFGDHNVANALAASLAVMAADEAHQSAEARTRLADGLRSFRALAHRLEVVGELDGVLWINDSKATNVSSTRVAIEGMTRPTILLLGGRHKGEPYAALAEPLSRVGKAVIAYGESAELVEQDLKGVVPIVRLGSDFARVIDQARAMAEHGDVVLLSPACSSYDMFRNYEERGRVFRQLVQGA